MYLEMIVVGTIQYFAKRFGMIPRTRIISLGAIVKVKMVTMKTVTQKKTTTMMMISPQERRNGNPTYHCVTQPYIATF